MFPLNGSSIQSECACNFSAVNVRWRYLLKCRRLISIIFSRIDMEFQPVRLCLSNKTLVLCYYVSPQQLIPFGHYLIWPSRMVTRDLFTIANLLDSIFKVGKSSWLMMLPGVDQLQQFHHQHTTGAVRDSQTCVRYPPSFSSFLRVFVAYYAPAPTLTATGSKARWAPRA